MKDKKCGCKEKGFGGFNKAIEEGNKIDLSSEATKSHLKKNKRNH